MHEKTTLYQETFEKNEEELIEKVWEEIAQRQEEQAETERHESKRCLEIFCTQNDGFECDICGDDNDEFGEDGFPAGSTMYGCRSCNFDGEQSFPISDIVESNTQ